MKKSFGFTLVEILVVTGIVVLVGLAISNFGRDLFEQNYVWSRELVAESEAKIAMNKIITELRTAQPSNNGAYPIELASSSGLVFYSDINNDGRRERLRYFLSGTALRRGETVPTGQPYAYNTSTESVSTAVSDLINASSTVFTYYDRRYDGTVSSPPLPAPIEVKNIRLIKVEFLIDANSAQAPVPLYLESQVMIRNLKDNQ